MTSHNDPAPGADRPQRTWLRRLSTTLAVICAALAFPIVSGVLVDGIPVLGAIGTIFDDFFSLHIVLVALAGLVFGVVARRLGGRRTATTAAVLNGLAALGATIPLSSLILAAHRHDAPISWLEHLHVTAIGAGAAPDRTEIYATLGGHKLYADIYQPDRRTHPSVSPSVFMIHGGGFTRGERGQARNWDRWLAARGYTVFDVDYRLAPPVNWNLAAQDVVCAMTWAHARAETLHIAADRTLVAGQSAGASLALQVAYGLAEGTLLSSCGGSAPAPAAVVAVYPAEDLALLWRENLSLGPLKGQDINIAYIGGSPEQFPDRYRATSALDHVRPGLPPTFVTYGEHDHLIPILGHAQLAARLTDAGVANTVLSVPYGDHGYDIMWGGIGTQIMRHVLSEFLERYFPVESPEP